MTIQNNILSIIERINISERMWKIPYPTLWDFHRHIKTRFENTSNWEKKNNKDKFTCFKEDKSHILSKRTC